MKFLLENQISAYLRSDKSIEQFIEKVKHSNYDTIRWIAIERNKDMYTVVLHEVFDEKNETQSVYDFSYVEPDDIYGKRLYEFDNLKEALEVARARLGADNNKYLPFGFLDEFLDQYST